jgi:hypothetical protein
MEKAEELAVKAKLLTSLKTIKDLGDEFVLELSTESENETDQDE